MSGRFPGAGTIDQFWQNLRNGVESILPLSDEDLATAGVDRALAQAPNFVRAAATLMDSDTFDASFFGYSPREADVLDPQQRLFLECAWEAIESAGYDPVACPGAVGVFAGMSASAYLDQLLSHAETHPVANPFQLAISTDKDYLTTRVAYKLNLKGPSITVQTACSTSLVAVVLACQNLLNYQCDMALAGGASVQLPQRVGYLYEEDGILSPDGHCRAFDAAAQGTVFGSGVGVVLCKRLDDALADGDNILAVIKGWAVNNDGASKVGFTAPSVQGQAEVIAMAQAVAEVQADTITYVEAHGTATALGDPLEVAALRQVFSASTDRKAFCAIGSVKTNVGHLDAAAGVAGLIKTILALQHWELPPSLYFREPNPRLDLAKSPFYFNGRLTDWPAGVTPRRAGVSSFGIGGTNAHIVLEEAPPVVASDAAGPASLLTLSAKTPTALAAASANLLEYLRKRPPSNLADVAYTLQVGRPQFEHRRVLACRSASEAVSALETQDPARVFTASREAGERPIVFMFPGQGAQYPSMTQGLYGAEPVFRELVDRCADLLYPELGVDIRRLLYPDADRLAEAGRELEQTAVAQPALFVVEYALARLWMELGVQPRAMIGHSSGEYPAACLAGVLSLEDALHAVAIRGRLMQRLPHGAMLAVPLAEQALAPLLGEELALAAVNGPTLCVVAGATAAVEDLAVRLASRGIEGVRLHT
ncbi:MAG: type I polyketide synthase, partial [Chloroflexota bacterium]